LLAAATALLGLAVLTGGTAAVMWLRREGGAARLGYAHAAIAVAGFAALLVALSGAPRGAATGTQSFGAIAAVLLGAALLAGLVMLAARLRARKVPGALLGAHATLAVSGFVVLAVYALLG